MLLLAGTIAALLGHYFGGQSENLFGGRRFHACGRTVANPAPAPALANPLAAPETATATPTAPAAAIAPPAAVRVPAPGRLGRATLGEPTVERTDPPAIASLERAYQPVVQVANVDRFWPVSVDVALALEREGTRTQLDVDAQPPRDAELSALTRSGTANDYLDYPAAIDHVQEQFCTILDALHTPDAAVVQWDTQPQALDPFRSAEIYVYRTDQATYRNIPSLPSGLVSLQYWFFYPGNYLASVVTRGSMLTNPLGSIKAALDYHEGDWEHVAVLLDPQTMEPRFFYMARHASNEAVAFRWGDPAVQWEGTHPVVHPSIGSHATYNRCGLQKRTGPIPDDWSMCGDEQLFTFQPTSTALVDLRSVGWSCWPGHFGQRAPHGFPQEFADGPRSPLVQDENSHGPTCG